MLHLPFPVIRTFLRILSFLSSIMTSFPDFFAVIAAISPDAPPPMTAISVFIYSPSVISIYYLKFFIPFFTIFPHQLYNEIYLKANVNLLFK